MEQEKKDLLKKFINSYKTAIMSQSVDVLKESLLHEVYVDLLNVLGKQEGPDDPDIPDSNYITVPTEFNEFQYIDPDDGGEHQPMVFSLPVQMPASAKEFESEVYIEVCLEIPIEGAGTQITNFRLNYFTNIDATSEYDIEDFEWEEQNVKAYLGNEVELVAVGYFKYISNFVAVVIIKEEGKTNAYCYLNGSPEMISYLKYVKIVEGECPDDGGGDVGGLG